MVASTVVRTPRRVVLEESLTLAVWAPTFHGGNDKFKVLQNSVFVGSETVADSDIPGQFVVGLKISEVFPVKTNITIGDEYP
jgi:hypothetical protein